MSDEESVHTEIIMPKFQNWSTKKQFYDYERQVVDSEDLADLNKSTTEARMALFLVTENINKYDRLEREAKTHYDRARRRAYLESTAKTSDERKMRADLKCEELENAYLTSSQIKEELIRLSHTLRIELQTLQTLGNNYRQQMRVM